MLCGQKMKYLLTTKNFIGAVLTLIILVFILPRLIYNDVASATSMVVHEQSNLSMLRGLNERINFKHDQLSLLYSTFGHELEPVLNNLSKLQSVDQSIADNIDELNKALLSFAFSVTRKIGNVKKVSPIKDPSSILTAFSGQAINNLIIKSAEYRVPGFGNIDITFLLQPLIFNDVLRIPTDYPIKFLLGDGYFPNSDSSIIHVEAVTSKGPESFEVTTTQGHLTTELYISNARSVPNIPFVNTDFEGLLAKYIDSKTGIEIGGPSDVMYFDRIYKNAVVDLINFSSKTLWGDFPDGSKSTVGQGTIRIMDGSYLKK